MTLSAPSNPLSVTPTAPPTTPLVVLIPSCTDCNITGASASTYALGTVAVPAGGDVPFLTISTYGLWSSVNSAMVTTATDGAMPTGGVPFLSTLTHDPTSTFALVAGTGTTIIATETTGGTDFDSSTSRMSNIGTVTLAIGAVTPSIGPSANSFTSISTIDKSSVLSGSSSSSKSSSSNSVAAVLPPSSAAYWMIVVMMISIISGVFIL